MHRLVDEELLYHTSSGGDWNGRLFTWNDSLYRGIRAASAPLYHRLFREGVIRRLCEKGLLIDSEIADLSTDRYPLVVQHRKIPSVSYPVEWSQGMLKDAARLILDLERELVPHGLTIHDAHPWNVVFDGPRPHFVDLGAIMPLEDDSIYGFPRNHSWWPAYAQFRDTLLNPLIVLAWGYPRIARAALLDYAGLRDHEVRKLAPWSSVPSKASWELWMGGLTAASAALAARVGKRVRPRRRFAGVERNRSRVPEAGTVAASVQLPLPADRIHHLERLRKRIEAIEPRRSFRRALSRLDDGGGTESAHFARAEERRAGGVATPRKPEETYRALADLFKRLRPASVLNLRSGDGMVSLLAAREGARVIACDIDEIRVENLYRTARKHGSDVLPLRMDVRSPTPGVGPCNEWLRPATERLRCDMVLALGLAHQLVFGHHLTFEQIVRSLDRFSSRWAVVDFFDPEDVEVRSRFRPEFGWYSRDNFDICIRRYFSRVEVLPSQVEGRSLFVCEKQSAE